MPILQISKSEGRSGFIVPSGIASDDSTKHYFSHITQNNSLVSLLDFENKKPLFIDVHRMFKFSLVTIGESSSARFAFFMTDPTELNDDRRFFELTSDEFRLINPNTLTCPVFRSQRDAELTKKIYRNSTVLIDETRTDGNPWDISFKTMFHMSGDSGLFHSTSLPDTLPLYEAKLIHQFDHRWATYDYDQAKDEDSCRDVTDAEKNDPAFAVTPRYWVRQREVLARLAHVPPEVAKTYTGNSPADLCSAVANWLVIAAPDFDPFTSATAFVTRKLGDSFANLLPATWHNAKFKTGDTPPLTTAECHLLRHTSDPFTALDTIMDQRSPRWLMGWRNITNATNERTMISSVFPRTGVGHSMPLYFSTQAAPKVAALLVNFNSLVMDYAARQKVGGTNLTYGFLCQFPILPPARYTQADLDFIVPRVLELTYTSHDLTPWARDLGYDGAPFGFDPARRALLRAELDAWYARLYGLTKDELRYILDPAAVAGADYPSETFRVLKDRELRTYNEYRTQRLVLEAWERFCH